MESSVFLYTHHYIYLSLFLVDEYSRENKDVRLVTAATDLAAQPRVGGGVERCRISLSFALQRSWQVRR